MAPQITYQTINPHSFCRASPPHSSGGILPSTEGGVIIRDVTLAAHTAVKQEEEQEEQELKRAYASTQPPSDNHGYSTMHVTQPTFTHLQSAPQTLTPAPKEEVGGSRRERFSVVWASFFCCRDPPQKTVPTQSLARLLSVLNFFFVLNNFKIGSACNFFFVGE